MPAGERARPFVGGQDNHDAAAQLPQIGQTCIAQHLLVSSVCYADLADVGRSENAL